jgi:DNA-binding NtrC family response regulator
LADPTSGDIRAALEREGGSASRTAAALGVSRQKLYRLADKHEIPIR